MKAMRAWIFRLAGLFRKARNEREMGDEIENHIAMYVADQMRSGVTQEEAHRNAVLHLGGLEPLREAYRERSTTPFLEHLALDVRFAFRQLRKNPGFAVTAVLILALALCASLAIFTFVEAALIRPLPYPEPARLVAVTEIESAVCSRQSFVSRLRRLEILQ